MPRKPANRPEQDSKASSAKVNGRPVRILVVSSATIPGFSGGWSTPLDVFGDSHNPMYLISYCRPGLRRFEGVPYLGLGLSGRRFEHPFLERIRCKIERELVPLGIKWCFRHFKADIVICLDELAGFAAMKTGLPFAMRFHSNTAPETGGGQLERLLSRALFSTATNGITIPGTVTLLHTEDISRYAFAPPTMPRKAILLCVLNEEHRPQDFIEGVMASRSMTGDIVGTGPLKDIVGKLCEETDGRVRLLPPMPRLRLGEISGRYQVGVATLAPRESLVYQMKVATYMACGMHVIASKWTDTVHKVPHLLDVYTDPNDLARKLDLVQENWMSLEDRRRAALHWVKENYSIEIPRRVFNDLLEKHFSGSGSLS